MLAFNFGNFFVSSFNLMFAIGHFSLTIISINLILFSAKGTLSNVPGASNFL